MATLKIKKGDTVKVIAGSEKGKEGKVLAVNAKEGTVLVEGVNMIKKHLKPGRQSQEGGIINQEGPINVSNVVEFFGATITRRFVKLSLLCLLSVFSVPLRKAFPFIFRRSAGSSIKQSFG